MPRRPEQKILGFQGKIFKKSTFTAIFGQLDSTLKYRRVKLKSGLTITESYLDHRNKRNVVNKQAQSGLRIRRK